jgi:hypothetical protein
MLGVGADFEFTGSVYEFDDDEYFAGCAYDGFFLLEVAAECRVYAYSAGSADCYACLWRGFYSYAESEEYLAEESV